MLVGSWQLEIFGYTFADESLLEEALTTPAYRMDVPDARDNQRLEFLGDAVLGMLSAERLYAEFPSEQEGQLTVRRPPLAGRGARRRRASGQTLPQSPPGRQSAA